MEADIWASLGTEAKFNAFVFAESYGMAFPWIWQKVCWKNVQVLPICAWVRISKTLRTG